MAGHIKLEPDPSNKTSNHNERNILDRCSICWSDPPVNAIKLNCGHVFCFLCIKSAASMSQKCALCRTNIDMDLEFDHLDVVGNIKLPQGSKDGYFWFYEGKTGWWMYDVATNSELEQAYIDGKKRITRMISGTNYVISLTRMTQYQKHNSSRARKICRDTVDLKNILGLAGLRNKKLLVPIMKRYHGIQDASEDLRF